MIDRKVLDELLKQQATAMENNITVELHLFSGEILFLQSVLELFESYVIVSVFPEEPLNPSALDGRLPKSSDGSRIFDRVILPYQTISYIRITQDKPALKSHLGFVS